jgi:hypothetical protein
MRPGFERGEQRLAQCIFGARHVSRACGEERNEASIVFARCRFDGTANGYGIGRSV